MQRSSSLSRGTLRWYHGESGLMVPDRHLTPAVLPLVLPRYRQICVSYCATVPGAVYAGVEFSYEVWTPPLRWPTEAMPNGSVWNRLPISIFRGDHPRGWSTGTTVDNPAPAPRRPKVYYV